MPEVISYASLMFPPLPKYQVFLTIFLDICGNPCGWTESIYTTLTPWLKPLFVGILESSFRFFRGVKEFIHPQHERQKLWKKYWQ